jgi:hypothetical protein
MSIFEYHVRSNHKICTESTLRVDDFRKYFYIVRTIYISIELVSFVGYLFELYKFSKNL